MVRGLGDGMVAHEKEFFAHLTTDGVHTRKGDRVSSGRNR
jgi:hypothetical protein